MESSNFYRNICSSWRFRLHHSCLRRSIQPSRRPVLHGMPAMRRVSPARPLRSIMIRKLGPGYYLCDSRHTPQYLCNAGRRSVLSNIATRRPLPACPAPVPVRPSRWQAGRVMGRSPVELIHAARKGCTSGGGEEGCVRRSFVTRGGWGWYREPSYITACLSLSLSRPALTWLGMPESPPTCHCNVWERSVPSRPQGRLERRRSALRKHAGEGGGRTWSGAVCGQRCVEMVVISLAPAVILQVSWY